MPTILLVRHGQASFGAADYDELSPTGFEQAAAVAEHLAARGLDVRRIVSGQLRRQRDTAAAAASVFGHEPVIDPRWAEYPMDEIVATYSPTHARASVTEPDQRASADEYQRLLEQALAAWIAAGDGHGMCESWPAFAARVRAALDELAADLSAGVSATVFTSGGVIAALCVALLELPASAMISFNRVAVNTGITKLVSGRRGVTLVSFNDHSHLEQSRSAITYR